MCEFGWSCPVCGGCLFRVLRIGRNASQAFVWEIAENAAYASCFGFSSRIGTFLFGFLFLIKIVGEVVSLS